MYKLFKFSFIVTVVVSVLVACGGADERKVAYLEKARQSIKAGNFEKARIELKNVLQIDPKFAEAYFELGKIFEEQKNYRKAYGNYLKAEELDPDNMENQARLGRFYFVLMKDEGKAQEKVDFILSKEPDNVDGLLLKAIILSSHDKTDDAISLLEKNFERAPGNSDNAAFLAAHYIKADKIDRAVEVLSSSLNVTPSEKLNLMLANIFMHNKEFDKAEKIFKQELENNPDEFEAYVRLAAFYNQTERKGEAKDTIKAAIEAEPEDSDRKLALIKLIKENEGNEAAKKELVEMINHYPSDGNLPLSLAALYMQDKQIEKAKSLYEKIKSDFPETEFAVKAGGAIASIHLREEEIPAAKAELDNALSISPNDPAINMLSAKIAINQKRFDDAILALRIVTKQQPENIDAYFLLAGAHSKIGEKEQANAVMNNAYESNRRNLPALKKLVKYYATINDEEKTLQVADDIRALDENNYEALSIKAISLNKEKSFDEAKQLAEKIMENYPDKSSGYLQVVPYYLSKGEADKAISILKDGFDKAQDKAYILKLLTTLQLKHKQSDEAIRRLTDLSTQSPDDENVNLLLAKAYLTVDEKQNAVKWLEKIVSDAPKVEEAYILLSNVYEKENRKGKAVSILEKGVKANPDSERISLFLARIYEQTSQFEKAIGVYTSFLKKKPENVVAMNNAASLIVDHRNDSESLKLARTYADKLKDVKNAVILDTVAWVYHKTGASSKAIEILKGVLSQSPEIGAFNYHLGMAYKSVGDPENARKYLLKSLQDENFMEKKQAQEALEKL